MNDIAHKLRQSYCLAGTEPTHPIRQAVEEIERLRESVERFMRLAAEARADADAARRRHDGPGGVVTAPSGWIACSNRVPDDLQTVLLCDAHGRVQPGWHDADEQAWRDMEKAMLSGDEQPTHWMPLPQPPRAALGDER